MSLVSLENLHLSFGADDVLRGVSGEINAKDRIGLVGRNGAGKTTLLHLLTGELRPNRGARHVARGTTMALVEQVPADSNTTGTIYDQAMSALRYFVAMEDEIERLSEAVSRAEPGADEAYAALQEQFEASGGYQYRSRLTQVLNGLGFAAVDWDQPVRELSGGQRTRLALACALLEQPELLILDEPTNHIDIDAMIWLDDFLSRWPGTILVTSHDRYFLDRVVNRVWLLENGQVRSYRGNYSSFEDQRVAELELQSKQAEAQAEYIAKEEAFIRRYRAGQRAREAKGREKKLGHIQRIVAPRAQKQVRFALEAKRSGEVVLRTEKLVAGYAEPLIETPDVEVLRGERIALIGANGSGKTTLLKTFDRALEPLKGSARLGSNVKIAHYWQEAENLDATKSVIEDLAWGRSMTPQAARDLLARFLFVGTDVDKPVAGLSGGERSRLALAKLVTEGANLLLLDEPTNHLDIPARESLEQALSSYTGSIVFVSHDRQLIAGLATKLWIVEASRLRVYDGTYTEYVERQGEAQKTSTAASTKVSTSPTRLAPSPSRTSRRQEAELARIEEQIASLEAEIASLSESINAASEAGDLEAIDALGRRFVTAREELEARVESWSLVAQ